MKTKTTRHEAIDRREGMTVDELVVALQDIHRTIAGDGDEVTVHAEVGWRGQIKAITATVHRG